MIRLKKELSIIIDNTRKTYTNTSYDVTIIEIREEDKIDKKSFFDIDKQIFQEDSIKIFKNRQFFCYTIQRG